MRQGEHMRWPHGSILTSCGAVEGNYNDDGDYEYSYYENYFIFIMIIIFIVIMGIIITKTSIGYMNYYNKNTIYYS